MKDIHISLVTITSVLSLFCRIKKHSITFYPGGRIHLAHADATACPAPATPLAIASFLSSSLTTRRIISAATANDGLDTGSI